MSKIGRNAQAGLANSRGRPNRRDEIVSSANQGTNREHRQPRRDRL